MIYIILFIALAILAFFKVGMNNKSRLGFTVMSFIIAIISIFRYGSGTDYFGYMWNYSANPSGVFESIKYESGMNVGYRALMGVSKSLNFSFELFVGIIAIIVMILFIVTIKKNSKIPIISLLIFYGVYYQIYVNSALRQGLAMAIFIFAFFKYYKEEKACKYMVSIFIASLFHYSVLITLIIPIVKSMYNRYFANHRVNIILFMISISSFILGGEKVLVGIANVFGVNIYYGSSGANVLAVALRLTLLIVIIILHKNSDRKKLSEYDSFCVYIYFINTILFISICNMPALSRLTEYFSLLDIFLIANLLDNTKLKYNKVISTVGIIILIGIIFVKDQASFIEQGTYYNKGITKYPYVTVFNKDEIYNYRYVKDTFKPR